mgnify:CR=1 FL=1
MMVKEELHKLGLKYVCVELGVVEVLEELLSLQVVTSREYDRRQDGVEKEIVVKLHRIAKRIP